MPHATQKGFYGGSHLTDYLVKIMTDRGYSFTTSAEKEMVRDIKVRVVFFLCPRLPL